MYYVLIFYIVTAFITVATVENLRKNSKKYKRLDASFKFFAIVFAIIFIILKILTIGMYGTFLYVVGISFFLSVICVSIYESKGERIGCIIEFLLPILLTFLFMYWICVTF